jgi:membrane protease YdiL (CAAX protease family)
VRWTPEQPQRIAHALALIVVRVVLLFFVGMGLLGSLVTHGDLFNDGWRSVLLVLGMLFPLDVGFVLGFGLLWVGRVSMADLGWQFDDAARDVVRGLVGFASAASVLLMAYAAMGVSADDVWASVAEQSLVARLMFLCIAVFGASAVEETLFRGYLQPALALRLGLPLAIVVQALIFDLMHLNFNPSSLVVKFLFGVIFGVLRGKDGSLLAPAVAHGLIWAVFGA